MQCVCIPDLLRVVHRQVGGMLLSVGNKTSGVHNSITIAAKTNIYCPVPHYTHISNSSTATQLTWNTQAAATSACHHQIPPSCYDSILH